MLGSSKTWCKKRGSTQVQILTCGLLPDPERETRTIKPHHVRLLSPADFLRPSHKAAAFLSEEDTKWAQLQQALPQPPRFMPTQFRKDFIAKQQPRGRQPCKWILHSTLCASYLNECRWCAGLTLAGLLGGMKPGSLAPSCHIHWFSNFTREIAWLEAYQETHNSKYT